MDYRTVLRAKGIKRIPPYSKLRTSKAKAKPGDIELIPLGSQPIATSDLTQPKEPPRLSVVKAA